MIRAGYRPPFRTVSRNHHNLLKMTDNKSRIVITVNKIKTTL